MKINDLILGMSIAWRDGDTYFRYGMLARIDIRKSSAVLTLTNGDYIIVDDSFTIIDADSEDVISIGNIPYIIVSWTEEHIKECIDQILNDKLCVSKTSKNEIDHPSHYNREGAMECIEEMETIFGLYDTMAFCKLCAWKYRYRNGLKDGNPHDGEKSDWYIRKYKELKERYDSKPSILD